MRNRKLLGNEQRDNFDWYTGDEPFIRTRFARQEPDIANFDYGQLIDLFRIWTEEILDRKFRNADFDLSKAELIERCVSFCVAKLPCHSGNLVTSSKFFGEIIESWMNSKKIARCS